MNDKSIALAAALVFFAAALLILFWNNHLLQTPADIASAQTENFKEGCACSVSPDKEKSVDQRLDSLESKLEALREQLRKNRGEGAQ